MKTHYLRCAAIIVPLLITTGTFAQTTSPATSPATAPAGTSTGMAPMGPTSASTPAASATAPANLSKADKTFITKAAEGGTAEVQMAQLAQQKSQDASVKQFAQSMIDDHTPNNEKLASLATQKGITAPTEPSAAQQKMLTKLQGLDGAKFDHAYLTGQVKAHQAMLKLFEREATNGQDTDVKAFAEATVPTIQKHLTMAQGTK